MEIKMSKWERNIGLIVLWILAMFGIYPRLVEHLNIILEGKGDIGNLVIVVLGFAMFLLPLLIGKLTAKKVSGGDNES
jgi:predicted MFS family arabinose efflux permease